MLKGKFTKRQRQVIEVLATTGMSNRDMAMHLRVAVQTIKNDLKAIYEEAGVESRVQLVLLYHKEAIDSFSIRPTSQPKSAA